MPERAPSPVCALQRFAGRCRVPERTPSTRPRGATVLRVVTYA